MGYIKKAVRKKVSQAQGIADSVPIGHHVLISILMATLILAALIDGAEFIKFKYEKAFPHRSPITSKIGSDSK